MPIVSNEKAAEVIAYVSIYGVEKAAEYFNLKYDTINRYMRDFKKENPSEAARLVLMQKIMNKYSDDTLKDIANGQDKRVFYPADISFKGDKLSFAFATDTHMGSVYFNEAVWEAFCKHCHDEKIDILIHGGDVSEGFSNRAGHFNELTHMGFNNQLEYSVEMLKKFPGDIYAIDGNHDRWYQKQNGALIVPTMARELDNMQFIGHDEGDILLKKTAIKVWHGEDSSSYATSYRIQKLVEAFSGGEKPQMLLCGHTHKQGFFFERNVHCISGGCMSRQSKWMRAKRIPAHYGFWIITVTINAGELVAVQPTWYPIYRG